MVTSVNLCQDPIGMSSLDLSLDKNQSENCQNMTNSATRVKVFVCDNKQYLNDNSTTVKEMYDSRQNIMVFFQNSVMKLVQFVQLFHKKRMSLSLTLNDTSFIMKMAYNLQIPSNTISLFEHLKYSVSYTLKLQPIFQQLLEDFILKENHILDILKQRREARTVFDYNQKLELESLFCENPWPSFEAVELLAHRLKVDKSDVHRWFCNR